MRLLKAQNTNVRNFRGKGIKYDIDGQVIIDSTNTITVPKGTTSERPVSPTEGQARYNTETNKFEFFENGQWRQGVADVADNVFYVSQSGSDVNDGRTISEAFGSLEFALTQVPKGSTIYVKAGDYTINNPVVVPEFVAVVGDSLRTVTIRAGNPTQDMFWVNNGSYLTHMTFKDHESPAAAVAFPPDGSAGEIFTSPYVQNCTSMTTTGTGMRVDGNHTQGLKSMVVDAFTQYNQGGIGIHMLNQGNTQLVSVFTICCDKAILCENGGFCSLTNSNSSFGNYGLVADGVSTPKYYGTVARTITDPTFGGQTILINNLVNRPYSGDAVNLGTGDYYTISTATDVRIGDTVVVGPTLENEDADLLSARTTVLSEKDNIKYATINFINSSYPDLDYNQSKCARDVGLIIDAVVDDMVLNTNYKTVVAGRSYYRASAGLVLSNQLTETLAAIDYAKSQTLALLSNGTTEYTRIETNFDIILNIIQNGLEELPSINYNDPTDVLPASTRAKDILQANRQFLIEEAIAYIRETYPVFGYDRDLCERDIGLIIDAVGYDMMFGSNFRSITAGRAYYREGAALVTESQKTATISAFEQLKSLMVNFVVSDPIAISRVTANMDIIINILNTGLTSVPTYSLPIPSGGTNNASNVGFLNARNNIDTNRDFIVAEVIQYITDNYPALGYDQAACIRDVNYILDAVYYDLTYGGNLESLIAGNAYYSNSVLQLGTGEQAPTIATYEFMRDLLGEIALNNDVTELQIIEPQVFGTAGSNDASLYAEGLINDIITTIDTGTAPAQEVPDLTWVDAGLVTLFNTLQTEKTYIQTIITTYIEVNFAYDQATCERDVGYIVDAISYDVLYGGNSQTIHAGEQYYSGGSLQLPSNEKRPTVNTFNYLKTVAGRCILNTPVPNILNTVEAQNTTNPASTPAKADEVRLAFDIINAIIETGKYINGFVDIVGPSVDQEPTDAKTARNIILAAKSKLQVDTIDYLNETYQTFEYNEAKCARDIDLILDAVAMDVALGSNYNSIVAGLAYQRANTAKVKNKQFIQTRSSIEFVKQQVLELQISETAKTRATSAFDEILSIFNNNAPSSYVLPEPSNADANDINAKDLLIANKNFIIDEVIAFINNQYSRFEYDEVKCARDVGLIIDAISLDLVLNTNYNSIIAGLSYRRANASTVITDQVTQTVAGILYLKEAIANLGVSNVGRINSSTLIDEIVSIIQTGTANAIQFNNPLNATQDKIDAKNQLQANKQFIQDEIVSWIADQIASETAPFTSAFTYNEVACARDVGLIVDALTFDILYGGNVATRQAADSYFVGALSQLGTGEEDETIAAYQRLQQIVSQIVQEQPVTLSSGTTASQNFDNEPATSTEATDLNSLIQIIIDVIQAGNTNNLPNKVLPDFDWSAATLQNDYLLISENKPNIATDTINYINITFSGFVYDQDKCARDVGYIVDALAYDQLYGGNSATRIAALSYFVGNVGQLGEGESEETIVAYNHMATIIRDIVQENSVTPTTGNTTAQQFTGSPATATEGDELANKISIIVSVIENGGVENVVGTTLPNISWVGSTLQSDFSEILTNSVEIQDATIGYITERFVNFNYNQSKCSRDVGLIIDAVVDDMILGTNYKSVLAGKSYYRASATKIVNDQKPETVAALEFLRDNVLSLIAVDSTTEQPEYFSIEENFNTIIDIIQNGTDVSPAVEFNSPTAVDINLERAANILQANRQFLIEEGIAFISQYYPLLGYDRDLCERDVGLIIDAVGYDMMFGSNFRSITAGRSYYRSGAAVVTAQQKEATVASFTYLKTLLASLVSANTVAVDRVNDNMDIIIDILDTGLSSVPTYSLPIPSSGANNASNVGYSSARDRLSENRSFIVAEVIQYITDNYPALSYDQAACERDVNYIIDAIYYDLTYGGNLETLVAARAYYSNSVLQLGTGEQAPTIATYEFMRDLINDVILTNDVTELQITEPQVFGIAGSVAAADRASALVDVVITTIDTGTAPAQEVPDLSWVDAGLVTMFTILQDEKSNTQSSVTVYIEENYAYREDVCRRDIGFVVDAVTYDVLYGGNSQTTDAGDEYYSGGALQIPTEQKDATIETYRRLKEVSSDCVVNTPVNALNGTTLQNTSLPAASGSESQKIESLYNIIIELLKYGYTSEVTMDEPIQGQEIIAGTEISFHQYSLITASGHTFEWVGSGTNVNSALPYEGGRPVLENQVIQLNGGRVYYTSTDQEGDFRIGGELTINRTNGTIEGDTFDRSLFAVLTPYILAIED